MLKLCRYLGDSVYGLKSIAEGCFRLSRPSSFKVCVTMTIINGTLAFDVAGNRNEYKCVDIDPETIFIPVKSVVGLPASLAADI